MKFSPIAGIIFTLFLGCDIKSLPDPNDCSKFKTGKFFQYSEIDGIIYQIDRNDSIQTESNNTTDNIVKAKIKWLTPCEYEVLLDSQTEKGFDSSLEYMRNRPMKTRIISTSKDYYVFESRIDSFNFRLVDTLRLRVN